MAEGFGYKWSAPVCWEDVFNPRNRTAVMVRCMHRSDKETPFRFLAWPECKQELTSVFHTFFHPLLNMSYFSSRSYPDFVLTLRAPIELENLLPYDLDYRIHDRDLRYTWSSYLRRGGVMPVHSVELGHMVLLSITVQDIGEYVRVIWSVMIIKHTTFTGLLPSDFAIINVDGKSDFDTESLLTMVDSYKRKLNLKINYVYGKFSNVCLSCLIVSLVGIQTQAALLKSKFLAPTSW